MPLRKVPVSWTTGIGGSGVSVFYSLEATDITVSLGTFFNALKTYFPTAVTWNIPSSGDTIEITTNKIIGSWSGGTAASIAGTGAGSYVAGTGAYVRWQTPQVVNGRRVKGRTFLCPLLTGQFDNSGTILDATVTAIAAAAATLAGTGTLQILHRPTTKGGTDGQACNVTGSTVPDKVTSLRTRRT